MGVVYLAIHAETGQRAAIKTLKGSVQVDKLHRLRREIRALRRLSHPGVVKVIDDGVHDGVPWYAMELLEGQSLRENLTGAPSNTASTLLTLKHLMPDTEDRTQRDALLPSSSPWRPALLPKPAKAALSADQRVLLGHAAQVCHALAYIHGQGLVHCDLKPGNIILTDQGRAVLVDFGVAMAAGARTALEELESAGRMAGTLHYLSPERITGRPFDARADLYALGCILYEIVTGRRVFQVETGAKILSMHLWTPPRAPSALGCDLPEPLEEIILALLSKRPSDRPGHAQVVLSALDQIPGVETTAWEGTPVPSPHFYKPELAGRNALLSMLEERFDMASRGFGQAVVICGNSGSGKTRLAAELITSARRQGAEVLVGEGTPSLQSDGTITSHAQPLSLFRTPIQQMLEQLSPSEARTIGTERLGSLERFLNAPPEGSGELATPEAAEIFYRKLLEALESLLVAHCHSKPLLMVFDDLQWADSLSLEVLAHLAGRKLHTRSWMMMGLARVPTSSKALGKLLEQDNVDMQMLQHLNRGAVGNMVQQMLGATSLKPQIESRIHLLTGGNPLFVAELIRAALERGLLGMDANGLWLWRDNHNPASAIGRLPLPSSVQDLLEDRVHALPEALRDLCEIAAIMGREALGSDLQQLSGLDDDTFHDRAGSLIRRAILQSEAEAVYGFQHDTLREVTYDQIDPDHRKRLHERAARYFEHRDIAPGILGWHWEQAGERQKAQEAYTRAARIACDRNAFSDADRYLTMAAGLTRDKDRLLELMLERAETILMLQGRHEEAEALLADLKPKLVGRKGWRARADLCLGRMLNRTSRWKEALEPLSSALSAVLSHGDRLAEGHTIGEMGVSHMRLGDLDRADGLFEEALEIGRMVGDIHLQATCLSNMSVIQFHQCNQSKAKKLCEDSLKLRRQLGDRRGESDNLANLGLIHMLEGRGEEAIALFKTALTLKRHVSDTHGEAMVLNNLAVLHHKRGQRDEAIQIYEQALGVQRIVQNRHAEASSLINLGTVYLELRRYSEAERMLGEALGIARETDSPRLESYAMESLGALYRDRGQDERAAVCLELARELARRLSNRVLEGTCHLKDAVRHRFAGRLDDAASCVDTAQALFSEPDNPAERLSCLLEKGLIAMAGGAYPSRFLLEEIAVLRDEIEDARIDVPTEKISWLERAMNLMEGGGALICGQAPEDVPEAVRMAPRH